MSEVIEKKYKCPYEPEHDILASRMQTHLVKCAASNKHLKMVRCPFSALHVYKRKELQEHIAVCDKRPGINGDEATGSSLESEQTVSDTKQNTEPLQEWDEEPAAASYLDFVQDEEQNRNVIKCLMLASKNQKKKFRRDQRMRFDQ